VSARAQPTVAERVPREAGSPERTRDEEAFNPKRLSLQATPPDAILVWAVLALTGLGLVMIYSASAVAARQRLGDEFFYLKR